MNEIKPFIVKQEKREIFLVTEITSQTNKKYYLYSDGNVYEKDGEGKLKKLDDINPESKKLIQVIMDNFRSGKTDVINENEGKKTKKQKNSIEVELPEL